MAAERKLLKNGCVLTVDPKVGNFKQADVLIHPDLKGINWFEMYEVNNLIKRGEEAAEKLLPAIKALVNR